MKNQLIINTEWGRFFRNCNKLRFFNENDIKDIDLSKTFKNLSELSKNGRICQIIHVHHILCKKHDIYFLNGLLHGLVDFARAYRKDSKSAMSILFYVIDDKQGLGLKSVFYALIKIMAHSNNKAERKDVIKNLDVIFNVGGLEDLMFLTDTPCKAAVYSWIRNKISSDLASMKNGGLVSLLARSLPSLESTNAETLKKAKAMAKSIKMSESEYKSTISKLRWYSYAIEEKLIAMGYELNPPKSMAEKTETSLSNSEDLMIKLESKKYMDEVLNRKRYQAP